MPTTLISDIIKQFHDLDHGDLWLDETFSKKLELVNDTNAFTRPLPELHSPAELLSHLLVWRRINVRRLNGETVKLEIEDPLNWRTNEELQPGGWEALKKEFYDSKQEVTDMLKDKDDSYLDTISTYQGKDVKYLLQGLVHHDLYHLGQLGISIKYLKK